MLQAPLTLHTTPRHSNLNQNNGTDEVAEIKVQILFPSRFNPHAKKPEKTVETIHGNNNKVKASHKMVGRRGSGIRDKWSEIHKLT